MNLNKQIEQLKQPLDASRIQQRRQGNMSLSYLEAFDVIDTANDIFGFDNWSYNVKEFALVNESKNKGDKHVICCRAIVTTSITFSENNKVITREDIGVGTNVSSSYGDAYENAAKSAVSDALKRALRTFGNQFGNCLYDKEQKGVEKVEPAPISTNLETNYSDITKLGLTVNTDENGKLRIEGDKGITFANKDLFKSLGFVWDKPYWTKKIIGALNENS